MTVKSVEKDPTARTMTITCAFEAPVERVLAALGRPPPAGAVVGAADLAGDGGAARHFVPGGTVTYFMTGPDGGRAGGWWRVEAIDAPGGSRSSTASPMTPGRPNPDMPTTSTQVTIEDAGGGSTLMVIESTFASADDMERRSRWAWRRGSLRRSVRSTASCAARELAGEVASGRVGHQGPTRSTDAGRCAPCPAGRSPRSPLARHVQSRPGQRGSPSRCARPLLRVVMLVEVGRAPRRCPSTKADRGRSGRCGRSSLAAAPSEVLHDIDDAHASNSTHPASGGLRREALAPPG